MNKMPTAARPPVIQVTGLRMTFGGLLALDEIDFEIRAGEIVALIGPNGAGKSTFFNCITGIYRPTDGTVHISPDGGAPQRITGLKPNRITEKGIGRTFQNIRLFPNMSTLENVMVARHCRTRSGMLGAITRSRKTRAEEAETIRFSRRMLERFDLERYAAEPARELPYGEQRRLEIARALATEPFLLLLDEPAAGLNPRETDNLVTLIRRIRDDEKISILLIEHDMKLVMSLSERIYVLDHGVKIAEGSPAEIATDPDVIRAYLGETTDA